MDTKTIVVTLLLLTIVLSVFTIIFNISIAKNRSGFRMPSNSQAHVGLFVEGSNSQSGGNDKANVGVIVAK